mgnify:CR=1 FL=1
MRVRMHISMVMAVYFSMIVSICLSVIVHGFMLMLTDMVMYMCMLMRMGMFMFMTVCIYVRMLVTMVVCMSLHRDFQAFLLRSADGYLCVGSDNPAFQCVPKFHMNAGKPQCIHSGSKFFAVWKQIRQSAHQHVSGSAILSFEI